MVIGKNQIEECDRIAEIVPYIYGESSPAERYDFEAHLPECVPCTDELAAIAEARFAVYEWNREEFSSIPTPAFVIPYENTPLIGESFAIKLTKIFGLPRFPAWGSAAAAFGALVLFIGIGTIVFYGSRSGNNEIAANNNKNVSSNVSIPSAIDAPPVNEPETATEPAVRSARPDRAVSVKVSSARNAHGSVNAPRRITDRPNSTQAKVNDRRDPRSVPTLSGVDDDVDDSLRLSDLFAEVDSLE